ncbi:putative scaffolding protein [Erwinia phage Micant]|uniref:Scaffolding protein n=1 Tax=Erwinia phage Micant TaxID=2923255 RepID=A0AAE9JWZ9_9CAUD|nr:putative scaffolding protein [Erwinia phage Micant]
MAEDLQAVVPGAEGNPAAVEATAPEAKQPTNADLLAAKAASKAEQGHIEQAEVPGKNPADALAKAGAEATEADKPAFDADDLAQTGNAVLDAGIKMMQQTAGLNSEDVNRILSSAFERGDSSLIDSAYIKERFGEHAGYVEQLAKAYIDHTTEQTQSTVNAVYELAGGEEGWGLHNQTFQQHAPKHLQAAASALADAGEFTQAAELIVEFSKSTGLVPIAGQHIQGGGAVANGALTAAGFKDELTKLRATVGNRSLESGPAKAQYDALVRRRQAGRMQNM